MTFYEPKKKKSMLGIVILVLFLLLVIGLFFSVKSCTKTGFLRSAKSSDANYLYQVYPASVKGAEYFISLEGVFKTSIYERKGGVTMRSGSTELRLTLHNLSNGETVARETIGNFNEAYSGIIGVKDSIFWMYNAENGIHGRNIPKLNIVITQADLINANPKLSEGLAMAQKNLSNINELYAFNRAHNALMLTTISGKNIWVDGNSFKTVDAPVAYLANNNYDDIINNAIKQAKSGQTININQITEQIIQATAGIGNVFAFNHLSNKIVAFDSCTYKLNGNTVRTIVKTDCAQKKQTINQSAPSIQFIEGQFLINGIVLNKDINYTDEHYNPVSTSAKESFCYIWHKDKIAVDAHRIISKYNYASEKTVWQFDATSLLGIDGEITRIYTRKSSLVIIFKTHPDLDDNFTCASINTDTGKMEWVFKF